MRGTGGNQMKAITVRVNDDTYKKLRDYARSCPHYAGNINAALREALHVFFDQISTSKLSKPAK
jgi:hypothetical protein